MRSSDARKFTSWSRPAVSPSLTVCRLAISRRAFTRRRICVVFCVVRSSEMIVWISWWVNSNATTITRSASSASPSRVKRATWLVWTSSSSDSTSSIRNWLVRSSMLKVSLLSRETSSCTIRNLQCTFRTGKRRLPSNSWNRRLPKSCATSRRRNTID